MRVFKSKAFSKWAAKEGLSDTTLRNAVDQMERGLVDADLGGHVFKKRVATGGRGKRGSARTVLAYKAGGKAFFIYGFAKSSRANIKSGELEGLKKLAQELLRYTDRVLARIIEEGIYIEIGNDG